MKLNDVTLLVEHHRGANIRRSRLGRFFIVGIFSLLGLILLGGITFVIVFLTNLVDYHQLTTLEYVDERQQEEYDALEGRLNELVSHVDQLEPVNDNLRLIHGFEAGLIDDVGIGGPELGAALAAGERYRVDLMHAEAVIGRQRSQLRDLIELNEQRVDYLAGIPSINPLPYARNCSGFGYRRSPITGGTEFHNGVDLVPQGNGKIIAAADGRVVIARSAGAYGLLVRIDHGYGYQTRYGHCRLLYVQPGDYVKRGEVIALVGCTGRSTGTHLHYEVLHDGINVDPELYILGEHEPVQTYRSLSYQAPKQDEELDLRVAEFSTTPVEEDDLLLDIGRIEHEMNPALDDPLLYDKVADEEATPENEAAVTPDE